MRLEQLFGMFLMMGLKPQDSWTIMTQIEISLHPWQKPPFN